MDVRPQRHVLANGLRLLIAPDRSVPVVCVSAWYGVGSRDERPGATGASHFVEHMLFKGGARFDKGAIWRAVSRVGGEENGFTDNDYTAYYETLPAGEVELGLEIERDRMADAAFEPAEVEAERTVVLSERDGFENMPDALLAERVRRAAFTVHPYRWDVIGARDDLVAATRDALHAHYRAHYAPNRAVLVVCGAVDPDRVRGRVEALFGDLAPGPAVPRVRTPEPPQEGERTIELRRPGTTTYLVHAYHVPAVEDDDFPALRVAEALLGGARSSGTPPRTYGVRTSRLYRDLVLAGLAADVSVHLESMLDPGLLWITVTLRHGAALPSVEDALDRTLAELAARGPTEGERARARRQIRMADADSLDGATAAALYLGWAERCGGHDLIDRLREGAERASADDVVRALGRFLRPPNRTVGRFIPEPEEAEAPETGIAAPGPRGIVRRRIRPAASRRPGPLVRSGSRGRPASLPGPASLVRPASQGPAPLLRPASGSATGWEPPRLARTDLAGGATLACARRPAARLAALLIGLPAGSIHDPAEEAGLASFTGFCLERGTRGHGQRALFEAFDGAGAILSIDPGAEATVLELKCLAGDLSRLLPLAVEILREPAFDPEEVEKVRGEILTEIREDLDDPCEVALDLALGFAYGPRHPYGRRVAGTVETISRITRDRIATFHAAYYGPAGAVIAYAGPHEPEALRDLLLKALDGWSGGAGAGEGSLPPPAEPPPGPRRADRPMPHKSQAEIAAVYPVPPRHHPDFPALMLANAVLGEFGLGGRIAREVREARGLAYHADAALPMARGWRPWIARMGTSPGRIEKAIEVLLREIRRIAEESVPVEELEDARGSILGSLPLKVQTIARLARVVFQIAFFGLPIDHLARFPEIIRRLGADDVLGAARRYLPPGRHVLAVAGPGARGS